MTSKTALPWTCLTAAAVALSLSTVGCGGAGDQASTVDSPAEQAKQQQDQIRKIESNPNMPPQAKAAAINAIRSTARYGQFQGTAQGRAQGGKK
jgi:hypothetical protein